MMGVCEDTLSMAKHKIGPVNFLEPKYDNQHLLVTDKTSSDWIKNTEKVIHKSGMVYL